MHSNAFVLLGKYGKIMENLNWTPFAILSLTQYIGVSVWNLFNINLSILGTRYLPVVGLGPWKDNAQVTFLLSSSQMRKKHQLRSQEIQEAVLQFLKHLQLPMSHEIWLFISKNSPIDSIEFWIIRAQGAQAPQIGFRKVADAGQAQILRWLLRLDYGWCPSVPFGLPGEMLG